MLVNEKTEKKNNKYKHLYKGNFFRLNNIIPTKIIV